jgi:hypothetical protein
MSVVQVCENILDRCEKHFGKIGADENYVRVLL